MVRDIQRQGTLLWQKTHLYLRESHIYINYWVDGLRENEILSSTQSNGWAWTRPRYIVDSHHACTGLFQVTSLLSTWGDLLGEGAEPTPRNRSSTWPAGDHNPLQVECREHKSIVYSPLTYKNPLFLSTYLRFLVCFSGNLKCRNPKKKSEWLGNLGCWAGDCFRCNWVPGSSRFSRGCGSSHIAAEWVLIDGRTGPWNHTGKCRIDVSFFS